MQIDIPVILKYSATVQGIMKKFKKVQTRKTVKVERDPRYHIMWQNKCSDFKKNLRITMKNILASLNDIGMKISQQTLQLSLYNADLCIDDC